MLGADEFLVQGPRLSLGLIEDGFSALGKWWLHSVRPTGKVVKRTITSSRCRVDARSSRECVKKHRRSRRSALAPGGVQRSAASGECERRELTDSRQDATFSRSRVSIRL